MRRSHTELRIEIQWLVGLFTESWFLDFVTKPANSCTQSLTVTSNLQIWLLDQKIGPMEYS